MTSEKKEKSKGCCAADACGKAAPCASSTTGSIEKIAAYTTATTVVTLLNHVPLRLIINGLTCVDCTVSLEEKLLKSAGVVEARVSFLTHLGEITYDTTLTDQSAIIKLIETLGYSAEVAPASTLARLKLVATKELADEDIKRLALLGDEHTGVHSVSRDKKSRTTLVVDFNPMLIGPRTVMERIQKLLGYEVSVYRDHKSDSSSSTSSLVRRWCLLFLLSLLFAVPVLLISFVFPHIRATKKVFDKKVFHSALTRGEFIDWILASPVQLGIAYPLYLSAYRALRYSRKANMDTLVVLSTSTAYVYSFIVASIALSKSENSSTGAISR